MKKTMEIPIETAAALVLACTAIDDILLAETLTDDIASELKHLQPYLNNFMELA